MVEDSDPGSAMTACEFAHLLLPRIRGLGCRPGFVSLPTGSPPTSSHALSDFSCGFVVGQSLHILLSDCAQLPEAWLRCLHEESVADCIQGREGCVGESTLRCLSVQLTEVLSLEIPLIAVVGEIVCEASEAL